MWVGAKQPVSGDERALRQEPCIPMFTVGAAGLGRSGVPVTGEAPRPGTRVIPAEPCPRSADLVGISIFVVIQFSTL